MTANYFAIYWPFILTVLVIAFFAFRINHRESKAAGPVQKKNESPQLSELERRRKLPRSLTIDLSNANKKQAQNQFSRYFNALKNAIKYAEKEIVIVDYIEHGTMMSRIDGKHGINLNGYYDDYFKAIEYLITKKKTDLIYKRVLSLPITGEQVVIDNLEAIEEVNKFIYDRTIAHIDRLKDVQNFELYIDTNSSRSFSSIFVDNSIWIRESDLWDYRTRQARPDMLEINQDCDYEDCTNLIDHNLNSINESLQRLVKIDVAEFLKLFPAELKQTEK